MKRVFSCFLALMIMMPFTVSAASTQPREAFEFFGLYIRRHMEICEYLHYDFETRAAGLGNSVYPIPARVDDMTLVMVSTPAGSITFSAEDHAVRSVYMEYYNPQKTAEENDRLLVNVLSVVSALEYSDAEEIAQSTYAQSLQIAPVSAADKVIDLWLDDMADLLKAIMLTYPVEETLFFSGNYDYYVSYRSNNSGQKTFFVAARTR